MTAQPCTALTLLQGLSHLSMVVSATRSACGTASPSSSRACTWTRACTCTNSGATGCRGSGTRCLQPRQTPAPTCPVPIPEPPVGPQRSTAVPLRRQEQLCCRHSAKRGSKRHEQTTLSWTRVIVPHSSRTACLSPPTEQSTSSSHCSSPTTRGPRKRTSTDRHSALGLAVSQHADQTQLMGSPLWTAAWRPRQPTRSSLHLRLTARRRQASNPDTGGPRKFCETACGADPTGLLSSAAPTCPCNVHWPELFCARCTAMSQRVHVALASCNAYHGMSYRHAHLMCSCSR